jgi:hypothetical protein
MVEFAVLDIPEGDEYCFQGRDTVQPCSILPTFRRNELLPFLSRRSQAKRCCLHDLLFDSEDGGVCPRRHWNFRLHGVTSQKIVLLIFTAVRISNPPLSADQVSEAVTLQTYIREVSARISFGTLASLRPCVVFLSPSRQIPELYLDYAASLQILSNILWHADPLLSSSCVNRWQ